MTQSDLTAFKRLYDTFNDNFRLTQLFSAYLNNFPDCITKDMVDTLLDGGIDETDAIAALLCEIFGLDQIDNPRDRRFVRSYILPAIRILDTKKYTENKYYKNVKIPTVKDGDWEFKTETYPPYRAMICDDIILKDDFVEIAPLGFFKENFSFPSVLEGGNEWMTLSPVDIDTCETAIAKARGKVVTFGLGLGYYAYMVSEKDEVNSIYIVEKSENVIRLFKKHILPFFTHPEKVKIINADAFEYAEKQMPSEHFDLAFVDTWRDASDGAPMYKRMKALENLSPDTTFLYWIENFLISRIRAEKFYEISESFNKGIIPSNLTYEDVRKALEKPISADGIY